MAFGDKIQGPKAGTAGTVTFDSSPTAGNLIILCAVDFQAGLAPGSGMSQAVEVYDAGQDDDVGMAYRVVESGDGATWLYTGADHIVAFEIEGPFHATPLDQTANDGTSFAPATKSSGTTGTTAQADEYAVAFIESRADAVTFSGWTNGFTELGEAANSGLDTLVAAGKVLSATGTVETTATITGTGSSTTGMIATFKKSAASTTLYFLDSAASGSNFGQLQVGGSAPSTATTATGWTVDTVGATNYALMAYASERASTVFSGTAQPAGNPDNSLGDCFRSTSTMSGDFATGVWTIAVPVIAVSAAAGQDGRVRVRLWKSANATGTSPTEITSGAVAGTTVTNLTTGAEQVSTVTTGSITGFSMANEYLFVQIAWEITGAAT